LGKVVLLLDIGTTTISGCVFDTVRKRELARDFLLNRQARFGDDIVTRIGFAIKDPNNAEALTGAVISSVNSLLRNLLSACKKKPSAVKEVYCAGNTAMHHLFLGIDPRPLVKPPYRPVQKSETVVYAKRIGLKLPGSVPVKFLPNIDGFVGSDALSVIIAGKVYDAKKPTLIIDIGTNGEIILGNKDNIFVASTAAGPAFEAKHIHSGMPASKGAICSVAIKKNRCIYDVIGKTAPKGICGSGLIDALAQMSKHGIMDKSGKMRQNEFVIYERGKTKIAITQQDVRKIQLAKAAIYAAVKVLIRKSSFDNNDISNIVLTGSFGSVINKRSIIEIGLLPQMPGARISVLKEGALKGLESYITQPELQEKLLLVLSKTKHLPLVGRLFANEFASSMDIGSI
jgi:uncharacterized 2Fe-2S/4Fe-4S cluster protein (DUF4445 family)